MVMPYDLNAETVIAIFMSFIVMFLIFLAFAAGLDSILSQFLAKIGSRLKDEFNARFIPGRHS
jgi:uncharacterized membrane protein